MLPDEDSSRREQIFKEYEAMADGYDSGSTQAGWSAPEILVQTLQENGLIKPGMQIVDFAAGTGALTNAFRTSAPGPSLHIVAADLSTAMLDKCREKHIADDFIQQDITKRWAVPESSKDIVAATGVGEYLTDSEVGAVIRQASHALKTGGKLAFTFLPAAEGAPPSKPDEQQAHTLSHVEGQCRDSGIDLQSVKTFPAYRADDGSTVHHILIIGMKR